MQTRLLTKPVPYTFVRGGYYYFTRRVPADLRQHYKYPRIVQGLRTSSPQEAKLQAKVEAAKLDAYWTQMRLAKSEVLGLSLIRDGMDVPAVKSSNVPSDRSLEGPTLLDALNVYFASIHASFHNLFNSLRSLSKRGTFKLNRDAALTE